MICKNCYNEVLTLFNRHLIGWHLLENLLIEQADLLPLRKLLTLHVHKDDFVEGHSAYMLEDGHVTVLLRRLNKIRGEQMIRR